MLMLYLMASHGYPPGLVLHHQNLDRVSKDCQPFLPIQGLWQEVIRPVTLNLRPYQWNEPWNPRGGFSGSSQFVNINSSGVKDSVLISSGIAEECAEREVLFQILMSGSSGMYKNGLNLSLLSDLMRQEAAKLHLQLKQHAALDFGSANYPELRDSLICPSVKLYFQEPLQNFVHDFLLQSAVSLNPYGQITIRGTMVEMKDLVSLLAEFYLARDSTKWGKQRTIIPHFRWTNIIEAHDDIYGSCLMVETPIVPMKSPEKFEIKRASKKKNKKKASKTRDLYKQSYSYAFESLLTLLADKKRDGKSIVNSLKKSGPELPHLLTQFAASIAGTGIAVIFSVMCKMASGRMPFSSTRLITTGFGVGLVWLSWAVNKLRDTIIYITKHSGKSGFTAEKMMIRVDKSANDIFFRAAALMAIAVLRFA
ncbi:hypothetical protein Ancab_021921 [Ancistrocladus abbreviatus]